MQLEQRHTPAVARIETREDGRTVLRGHAAVFYRAGDSGTEYKIWDDLVERIQPGAFDRALREDDVRALFNHDSSALLGRTVSETLRLSVDAKGLRYEVELPDTTIGKDVAENVRRGDLTGSSFAFRVREQVWRDVEEDGKLITIRELVDLELYDVGPVTYPAYESTSTELASRSRDSWRKSRPKSRCDQGLLRLRFAEALLTD